jgi:hypothetical protein
MGRQAAAAIRDAGRVVSSVQAAVVPVTSGHSVEEHQKDIADDLSRARVRVQCHHTSAIHEMTRVHEGESGTALSALTRLLRR